MTFDSENPIIRLCAEGINREGQSRDEARTLYQKAWDEAASHYEKFIAAHYLARVQPSVADKLRWDGTALAMALQTNDESAKAAYPSLYLNLAKGYEDLNDLANALKHYQLALSHSYALKEDGYGKMIMAGITAGIDRVQ